MQIVEKQQAEIERLKKLLDNMTDALVKTDEACRKPEAEVIKDFAERLKEKANSGFWDEHSYVSVEDIVVVLEEMVGDVE